MTAAIEATGLHVAYGAREVLRDVAIRVDRGEVVGLAGPNGSGKTTLLRALSRVVRPLAGTIELAGRPIESLDRRTLAREVAVLPQNAALPGEITVLDAVVMGRTPHLGFLQQESATDFGLARAALRQAGLDGFAERRVRELSGGERQLVLLARALAQGSPTLLLDEPSNSLDIRHQVDLFQAVRSLAAAGSHAVLAALHDLSLAALYCDRLVLMARGQVVAVGTPREVLTADRLSATYGTPLEVIEAPGTRTPLVVPATR